MLENESQHRVSKTPERMRLGLDILRVLAAGSIILASPVMPRAFKLLPLLKLNRLKEYREWDLSRAMRRLKSQGFIALVATYHGFALKPTRKGEVLLARYEAGIYQITTQKHWDGKWRVIIFDIPEGRKQIRETVRLQLKRWRFYHLQRSVFVYPYECEEAIELLKTAYAVRHDIYYLVVARMAGDHKLREYFGLLQKQK